MTTNWNPYTVAELAQIFWGYYKDVHGVRPRWVDLTDREVLVKGLESLDSYMESMKSTPEGLAQLREEGWTL
jgi:hypothetical protein